MKTALRAASGNWLYTSINLGGLCIGLACCLLILLYVHTELSWDQGFADADRIYRVSREVFPFEGARARIPASNNGPVAPALKADLPVVEQAGRVWGSSVLLQADESTFEESALRYADQGMIDVFGFDWLAGDKASALASPDTIVLTESLARKYFNSTEVLGRTMHTSATELRVTGVIRDLPANTHLDISGMIALIGMEQRYGERFMSWNSNTDFHTYVKLQRGSNAAGFAAEMPAFITRHQGPEAAAHSAMVVSPIKDIHLHSNRDEEMKTPGSSNAVYSFIAIAFAVLAIACINFMSIATARSSRRAREVGMRKVLGASRAQLIGQFLGESALMVLAASIGALALAELLAPTFSALMDTQLQLRGLFDAQMLMALVILLVGVSVMAGAYPAFFLSAFEPSRVLKGELTRGRKGLQFRNVLVVLQFAIAITLLIATVVIQAQRHYANRFAVGFNKDQIVVVHTPSVAGFGSDWTAFKQQLLKNPAIENVTASHYLPFGFNDNQIPAQLTGNSEATRIQYMMVDYDFFATYAIPLVAGRAFSHDFPADSVASKDSRPGLVLNHSAARALGLDPADVVGRELTLPGYRGAKLVVVGVTADIYFESLRLGERPLMFMLSPAELPPSIQTLRDASIRIKAGQATQALAHIDATWRAFNPSLPVNRRFLSTDFATMYQADQQQGRLLTVFAVIAVAIACFGLFGLASFNAERRMKEIGVRKVMGSSVWGIVVLLTNDFSRLVLLSNLIAWPVAYYAMHVWLQSFAYRIDLTPMIFIGSGLVALCIAWVTVGGTAAKAANQKPVLALRYE